MSVNWVEIAAMLLAAVVAIALIVLLKRGLITADTVGATGDLLESLPIFSEDGFVAQLFNYCRLAVRAVEQMVKAEALPHDDDIRKAAAVDMVETYAKLDGVDLGEKDHDAIENLIEAAVLELPKTN